MMRQPVKHSQDEARSLTTVRPDRFLMTLMASCHTIVTPQPTSKSPPGSSVGYTSLM